MKKCSEYISSDGWHSYPCRKEYSETVNGKDLCKIHAKSLKIRLGLDTGETLQTRYFVTNLGITEFQGVVGKKQFTVRKRKELFGDFCAYDTNIPLEHSLLFEKLEDAKTKAKEWTIKLLKELDEEIKKKSLFLSSLELK